MEDMLVMTSSKFLTLLIFFFLSTSCETINELTGLAKPELDDSLAIETPDLVLPPDFGKEPRASMVESKQNIQQKNNAPQISQPMMSYQTINPRITNYYSPRINVQSSPTPSDSLEKFKKIKNLPLVNGFIANMLMVLKGEIYIIGRSMIRVIIFLDVIYLEVTFHPFQIYNHNQL